MNSIQFIQIWKIRNVGLFLLFIIDLILLLLFKYYQPLCEPCVDRDNCPPCLSDEQYFIVYLTILLNLLVMIYGFYKYLINKKTK
jgi:hypothetical protein